MAIELFLHVGYPKTGTSSLQYFFAENEERLLQGGVLYPKTGRRKNAHYALNFSLGLGNYDKTKLQIAAPDEFRRQLAEEATASGCRSVLVSSEYFITAKNIEAVRALFADFDVKVVVYIRRHDDALASAYGQSIKTSFNPPWDVGIESFIIYQLGLEVIPFDYLTALRRWADVFGVSNIIVKPFERKQLVPDLYGDFLVTLGIDDPSGFVVPERGQNTALPSDVVRLIDLVQHSDVSDTIKLAVIRRMVIGNKSRPEQPHTPYMSPVIRNAVIARYRTSYQAIAREFLNRPNGGLFHEPVPAPETWVRPKEPTGQEAIELLLQLIGPRMR